MELQLVKGSIPTELLNLLFKLLNKSLFIYIYELMYFVSEDGFVMYELMCSFERKPQVCDRLGIMIMRK